MKIKLNLNGGEIEVDLTPEQINKIKAMPGSIEDRIDGWESVAAIMGFHPVDDLPYPNPKTERQEAVNAFFVMDVAADAYNEGKIPDFQDAKQEKWFDYFKRNPSGFGFLYSLTFYAHTHSYVGARLSLLKREHVADRAKKFDTWIQKLLTKTKQ